MSVNAAGEGSKRSDKATKNIGGKGEKQKKAF